MKYYRCGNCGEVVKADKLPRNINESCLDGNSHSFQELGEIGDTLYECENCGIRLNFNNKPNKTNDCHKSDFHNWLKSSGNLKNIKFSKNDSMKNKHIAHRKWLNLLGLVKAGAAGVGIIFFGGMFLIEFLGGIYLTYPVQSIIVVSVIVILIIFMIIYKIKKRKK